MIKELLDFSASWFVSKKSRGSEEVESLVGSEAEEEWGTRRGRRKAEEAWDGAARTCQ